jgi:hypothetical protein
LPALQAALQLFASAEEEAARLEPTTLIMPPSSSQTPNPREQAGGPQKGSLQWNMLAKGHDRKLVSFQRPVAVTIACAYNVFFAILMIVLVLVLDNANFKTWFAANEISPSVYFANLYVVAVLLMVATFGMWEGATWSWWLMVILQVYTFVDVVGGLILNSTIIRSSVQQMSNPIRFAKDAAVSSLWFLYFFTNDVLAFFQRSQERKLLIACGVLLLGALLAGIKLAIAIWLRGV